MTLRRECGHCGRRYDRMEGIVQSGIYTWNLCHPDRSSVSQFEIDDGWLPDCYRLVTVYGEEIGSRKVRA